MHEKLEKLHGAEPFLRSRQLRSHSRMCKHCVEPENSLPCSEVFSTGLYPESYQSYQYHPIVAKIHLNIILLPMCRSPSGERNEKCVQNSTLKPERWRSFARPGHRREDNIKRDSEEVGYGSVEKIHFGQNNYQRRAVMLM
jgi:hypothetical protein